MDLEFFGIYPDGSPYFLRRVTVVDPNPPDAPIEVEIPENADFFVREHGIQRFLGGHLLDMVWLINHLRGGDDRTNPFSHRPFEAANREVIGLLVTRTQRTIVPVTRETILHKVDAQGRICTGHPGNQIRPDEWGWEEYR